MTVNELIEHGKTAAIALVITLIALGIYDAYAVSPAVEHVQDSTQLVIEQLDKRLESIDSKLEILLNR